MQRRIAQAALGVAWAFLPGCLYTSPGSAGLPCTEDSECDPGQVCSPAEQVCVDADASDQGNEAGDETQDGDAGDGDAGESGSGDADGGSTLDKPTHYQVRDGSF